MLHFFLPYRSKKYILDLDVKSFQEKLFQVEQELHQTYEPGKYYIVPDSDKPSFLFKNVKFNAKKESGIISTFKYSSNQNKTIVNCHYRYSTIFYFFLPLIMLFLIPVFHTFNYYFVIGPLAGYILFCFFLHLEAWVVDQEFKKHFESFFKSESVRQ